MSANSNYDALVIGGGVVGLSSAMQLAKAGLRTLVLEKNELGSGSTGSAAGLVGQLRSTKVATQMMMDGLQIVGELEDRIDTGIYFKTGSVRIGANEARAQEVKDHVEVGRALDFNVSLIDKTQLSELLPYMKTEDILAASYSPTDGHIQPAELAMAYIKVGKSLGVEYRTQSPVTEILLDEHKVLGVQVGEEKILAPVVLNAAGLWSPLLGEKVDTIVPTAPLAHYYLVTNPNPETKVDSMSPGVRDRENLIYTRPEVGGLLVGIFEQDPILYPPKELSDDFEMSKMKAARDDIHVAELIYRASCRFPFINEKTPLHVVKGIINYSPDDEPLCGEMPNIKGLFHCAGFSHGIAQSPSIGVVMAELITKGESRYDIDSLKADRFFSDPDYSDWGFIHRKCHQTCANYYAEVRSAEGAP